MIDTQTDKFLVFLNELYNSLQTEHQESVNEFDYDMARDCFIKINTVSVIVKKYSELLVSKKDDTSE